MEILLPIIRLCAFTLRFIIGAFLSLLIRLTISTDKNVKKNVSLCVAIISAPSYYKERNLIRRTWTGIIPVNVSVIFFIGTLNLPLEDELSLRREKYFNQDIFLLDDVEDTYDNFMPRSHIYGLDARLATDTIRHHSWQLLLVRSFPYCIRNHT